eukprot:Phypoly_transcript_10724.p1 GENE.Phypoly_transcript_10724~~Phypoly_transcript_10724.p1  ORF type:complete len:337 (-),score=27.91 Phypoly_transcript_10724:235-1245(-)
MSIVYEKELSTSIIAALDSANLPEGVVIRRNKYGKWVGFRETPCRRLDSLGPFATNQALLSIQFHQESGRYDIDFTTNEKFGIFDTLGILSSGSFGPLTKVTLEGEAKAAANIPAEATHFCFCYPLTGVATLSNYEKANLEGPVAAGDPEFTFLTFGGFAYFECSEGSTTFLRTNALVQGETGITFEGPFTWKSSYTKTLYRASRFEPITISSLSSRGLQLYCFINPNEVLETTTSGFSWMPCPNGGFVYLYNEDGSPHPLDCYFSVASQAKEVPEELRIKPFSVVEKLNPRVPGNVQEYSCTVCLERTIRCILLPCKHLCMCTECVKALNKKHKP